MSYYIRHIDWPLVTFAILGCYLLPLLLAGTVVSALLNPERPYDGQSVVLLLMLLSIVVPPILAGGFSIRFAKELPRFHVGVIGLLGSTISVAMSSNSLGNALLLAGAVLALTCLGEFIQLRWRRVR